MTHLIESIFNVVIGIIEFLGYWGIGIGMAIESMCIPLPSEIILPLGGYLASTGKISFWGAVLAGTFGGLIGSIVCYYIGAYAGRPFIIKYGKYVLIREHEFDKADRWFRKYGNAAVFTGRLLPIVRTFISLPAGIAKVSFWKFIFYTILGSFPWSVALTYGGYVLGNNWMQLRSNLHYFNYAVALILIILVALYLKKHFAKKQK